MRILTSVLMCEVYIGVGVLIIVEFTKDERIAQLEKQVEQISKERDELHNALLNDDSAVLCSDFAILRLGEVLDNISGGVVLCEMTKGFPIVYVSRGFTTLTGYTLEDLYHAEHSKIIADPSKNVFGTIINEKKDSEDIFTFEYKMLRKDKTTFWVMDNAQIIIARDKKQYIQSMISDITHYKDVEQALRISQKSYDLVMAFSDITLFEYDVQTKRITTQTSDFEKFGMPAVIEGGMEGIVKLNIIAQRSKQDFKEFYNRIDRGDANSQCTICVNDLSGSERILQLQLINIFDDDGKPIRAVGMRKDVTEAMHLKHEKDFGEAITSELLFAFEANVTHDKVVRYNSEWAKNLRIKPPTGYKQLMKLVCDEIYPEYAGNISYIFSEKAIIDAFEKGRRILKAEFKYSKGKNKDLWLETGINIIKDGFSGDISIRVYTTNINSRKVKEQKAIRESKHYELMISKSATVYEVNITRNSIAFGTQNWEKMFGIKTTSNYSEMVASFAIKATYPEDSEGFTRRFTLNNVLKAYAEGKTEICHEYRRPDEDGKFIWVRCTMHLFEDPVSNELRGFAYVENINTEKEKELELVYKSTHDLLTGFYNKSYVEEKINQFLTSAEGKHGTHIFYIIDIDYFKHFNDAFGHAFGDAVLSQTAAKISMLFRDDDIMGRIGGDEFVVLMKNVQSERKRESKAFEICNNVREVYSKRGEDYDMSVSIGAAIYSNHGTTYDELYRHSDAALYDAKQKGRDTFSLYSEDMQEGVSAVNTIDGNAMLESKGFEKNITEYVFRIMYDADDKTEAIQSVLELLAKHYNLSRVSVFEKSEDSKYVRCTFEWATDSLATQRGNLQMLALDDGRLYQDNFDKDGILFLPDIAMASCSLKSIFLQHNVKSLVQIAFEKNSEFMGFISFDSCDKIHIPNKNELTDYHNIANIMGVFVLKMRALERCNSARETAYSIVNSRDSFANVCDAESFELLFVNDKIRTILPNAKVGEPCYKTLWNKTRPCDTCPMLALRESGEEKYVMETYNSELKMWLKETASWINWLNGKSACLVDIDNITEYKTGK